MASEFLKKKAQERAESIEKTYGSTAYGASDFLRRKAGVSTATQNNPPVSVQPDRVRPNPPGENTPSTLSIQPDRLRPGWSVDDLFPREEVEASNLPEAYREIRNNADYQEKSKYVPTGTGKQGVSFREALLGQFDTGYDDPIYEYVNGNQDAILKQFINESRSGATLLGTDSRFLNNLNDTEKGTYNYIHATQGKDAADQFLRDLQGELNARQRAKEEKELTEQATKNDWEAARMSAFSTLTKPLSVFSYLQQAEKVLGGEELDPNAGYNRGSYTASTIRNAVSKQIENSGKWGKVGSYGYNLGMSAIDFLYNAAITGGVEPLALAVMGTEAAADSVLAAKERGLSDERSFITGTIAGIIEAATEHIGFDALFKTGIRGLGKKGFAKYILRNAGAEAAEEGTASLLNWLVDDLYDIVTSTKESEFKKTVSAYEENGLDHKKALLSAIGDRAKELGLDTLGGFLSGLFLSGAKSGFNAIQFNDIGKEVFDRGQARAYVGFGLDANPNTEAYQYAKEIQSKLDTNQKVTNIEMGQLAAAVYDNTVQTQEAQRTLLRAVSEAMSGRYVSNRTAQEIMDSPQALGFLINNGLVHPTDTSGRGYALDEIRFGIDALARMRSLWENWTKSNTASDNAVPFVRIPERATPEQQEEARLERTETVPAWYEAYQNSLRQVDRPMRQRPTLQLPAVPGAVEEALGNVVTAPKAPAAQNEAQAPVEGRNGSELPNGSGLVLPSAQETPELTPAQEQGIVKETPETTPDAQPLPLPTAEETIAPEPAKMELPTADGKLPHEVMADFIRREIEEGNTISPQRLQEFAEKAFGGTRGSGAYDIKTAYDAMELAVNQYLMNADFVRKIGNGDVAAAELTEAALEKFMRLLPTQSVRTEEQQQYQQFSTPPNIAYLAAWAANISDADTVLEPSAGIGGLALWPKAWGATVYGNELSPRRAQILRSLGLDEVFVENAEQINNVLPDRIKPTVVLMNPPFSATAGRLSTNNTANAKRHIEQALDRLEDGGRLVAILGQGMANDSKTFSRWWNDLRTEYNIRANLSIDGKNYHKYGTTWGVQLVVIDKTGPQTGETITGEYTDLTEIPSVLEGIRNDRTELEGRTANAVGRSDGLSTGPVSNGLGQRRPAGSSERPTGGASGNDGSRTPVRSGNGGRVQPAGTGENGLRAGEGTGIRMGGEGNGTPGGVPEQSQPERNAGPESALPVRGLTLPGPTPTAETPAPKAKPTAASKQRAGNDDNVFAEYVPPKTPVKGAKKHPAKLVESAAMAAVDAPTATYTPNLPKELITSGALSDVQLTNIVYAGQAHSQMIPGQNKRKGYFIGDGTGVGKGRQLAGIILDNFRQGRTKALWISKGQNLYPDAKRDWKAMGMDPEQVISTQKIKADAQIKAENGILFTTYDTLANTSKTGKSRLDQIVDWLGEDFDGVICFDEAHTMGNLLGKQSKRGNSKPAQRAIAGAALQNRLPNARIVYASATMATDVSEMAFAERLGLWGAQTQFTNVRDFVSKISDGGMAAMELVARDMKAMGVYQARSISYDGVEYDTLQHDLSPMQKEIYNTMSRAWQITLQNMNKALEMTGANLNGNAKGKAKSAYYGALQRFYNQILTSMAVPSVIQDMKKELAKGRSIVIQIVNTNEAETERQLAKAKETGENLDDLDITPRENLIGYLRNSFPVQVYQEEEDENGNKRSVPVTDSQGNPVLDKKAVAMRDALIAQINEMAVPEGPLEMIYDAFGTENVAEVTGRSRRIVPGKDEYGNTVKIEEKRSAKSGEADANAFQDGKKRILIFSDAGGTGKSYHADRTAINQQQRVHYLLQPGWSAPKAVQGFGRTHRSNEASAPIYKLVTTDVKGQKRFVSTIARRLDQLGALTKGQRQTGSGMFSARDNLESDLATDSLYNFYRALVDGQIEGLEAQDVLEKLGLMDKFVDKESRQIKVPDGVGRDMSLFLNRILALEYDEQNLVFDAFSRIFDDAYETALANGTLDMGMETVRADKIDILDDMVVREDPNTGAATNYVQAKLSEKARIVKTIDDLKALRGDFIGLYRKKNGDAVGVFRTKDKTEADGSVVKQYILQTPQERKISRYVEKTLKNECTRIPEKEWKTAWAEEVGKAPEYIETVKHMLTGSLLPVWNRLPKSGNVRVQRLIADDGRQYLGRIIDPSQIDDVLKSLGVSQGRTKQAYTADDVIKRVYKGGDRAVLEDNQVSLIRRRVGNEWRIEITGRNLWYLKQQFPAIVDEIINYNKRYFIPNGEQQKPTLEGILEQNPVRDIESARGDVEESRDAANFNGNTAPRHPENWTATRVGDKNKTPMSGPDIVQMIRDKFGIPVTTGHIRSAEARAQYRQQPQTIRTKVANSIPDIGHELGHHLDNIFDIQHSISKEAKAEIVDAMPDSFKAKYKNKSEWPGEGVAEFMRRYLQNSETAAIDFPKFTEEFFNLLDKKTAAAVEQLADEVNAFYSLSEDTGNYPIHNYEDKGHDFRETDEKLREMNTHIRMLFVDTNEPIRQIDRQTGDKVHMFATNAAYAENRAYMAITGDLFNLRGTEIIYDGLQTVLKDINMNSKREFTDFGWYLVCRHAPWRLKQGMRVTENDALDNTAYFEETKERLEKKYPQFEKTADKLYEFIAAVRDEYGVKSGFYTKDVVDSWIERFGPYYVPLNRWFGDEKVRPGQGDKRSFANQTGIHGRAIGSGLDIINPVDNVIINTVRMVNAAIKNDVAQKLSESISRLEGGGYLMEKIPPTLARKTWDGKGLKAKTLDEFEKYFEQMGADFDPKLDDLFQKVLDNSIDDVLVQYGRGKASGDIITIMKNGEPEYWKVNDPYLLQSLTHMSSTDLGALLGYIGHVTRFITGNITGLNLAWSLGSNLPRDLGSVIVYSPDKHIFQILRYIGQFYGNKFRKKAKQTFEYKQFMALGGNSVTAMTSDVNMTKKARRDIQKRMRDWFIHPIETLEYFGNVIEGGTRYAVFVLCLHKGMTPEEAFYVAMESTVNFKRKGLLTPSLNVIIPFSGASIQGMDRLIRYFEAEDLPQDQRKGGRAKRIAIYLAVSLAIAAMEVAINSYTRRRRDNWEKLSVFTKNNYFTFQLPNGKHFSVPKPREIAIAISYFERLFELLINKNPHAFDDFWEYVTDNTTPGVLSGILQGDWNSAVGDIAIIGTVHYLTSNKDFLGRAIVPNSMIDLPKRDQYDQTTSKLAKLIGETLNWSPKKIDFFMNNTLAAFWKALQSLAPVSGKTDLSLGVASKWVKDPLYSTDIPNRIYALRDELKVEHNGNPSDMQIAARYRLVSDAAEFYGKYYKLAKNDEENARNREIRVDMLDALLGIELNANNEESYRFLMEVINREGSTEYMPTVFNTVIKGDNSTAYSLNSEEYFMMQTRYFSLYYDYIQQAMDNRPKMGEEERTQTVIEAKELASVVARGEVIEAKGGTLKAYTKIKDLMEDDVDEGDLINFLAASSTRLADTDGNGKTSNAELLLAAGGLKLPTVDTAKLISYNEPALGLKLQTVGDYGVDATEYGKVLDALGDDNVTQANMQAAIDAVYGRTTNANRNEKAAMWQAMNKGWNPKNNPYSQNTGRKVQNALTLPTVEEKQERPSSGLKLPTA